MNPRAVMAKEAHVVGCFLWHETLAQRRRAAELIVPGLVSGDLRPPIAARFPLHRAADAHAEGLVSLGGEFRARANTPLARRLLSPVAQTPGTRTCAAPCLHG